MKNTIYLGDCLNILPSIPDKSVDLVICDLPYGELKGLCKWDIPIDMNEFWKQMKRILKTPKSPVVLWGSLKFFSSFLYPSNPKWYRYEIPVSKSKIGNPLLSLKRVGVNVEYMFVFSKECANFYWQNHHTRTEKKNSRNDWNCVWETKKKKFKKYIYEPTLPKQSDIIKQPFNNVRYKTTHPTKKCAKCQYDLCKYLVEQGGTVLDPCMGIGTSLETAKMLKCSFIGIEKEPKYFYQNTVFSK